MRHARVVRVTIRVRPGAGRTTVGGLHDGALVVRVSERAVDGRATAAALAALASALGLRPRQVTLVSGKTSRTKVVELPDEAAAAYDALRSD
jgi:uncharacterized protein YggU (UPF0235/DUF167 family)